MNYVLFIVLMSAVVLPGSTLSEDTVRRHVNHAGKSYDLYPTLFTEKPGIPSPLTTENGIEVVVCFTNDGKYTIIPVTVENGDPLNYKEDLWYGKGRQLDVDSSDFPVLAATGLHSNTELDRTRTITGRSIDEITRIARPEEYSGVGFISHDEDIVSVLKGDNQLVHQLGMTHPTLAKPLFHIFNVILNVKNDSERSGIQGVHYNNRKIYLRFWGAKGWQESIFDDEILGYWEIEIWRDIDQDELAFLSQQYSNLSDESRTYLIKQLSHIHTGEMVPFYIMRYGFYEGHTGFRADPIAIAFIFGLLTIDELERAFEGHLYEAIAGHHLRDNAPMMPSEEGE